MTVGIGVGVTTVGAGAGVGVIVRVGTVDGDAGGVGVGITAVRAVGVGVTAVLTGGVREPCSGASGVAIGEGVWVGAKSVEAVVKATGSAVLVTDADGLPGGEVETGTTVDVIESVGETPGNGVVVETASASGPSTELSHAVAASNKRVAKTPSNTDRRDAITKLCGHRRT